MSDLTSTTTVIIDLCKQCMELFSEFPMNLFLVGGLVGIGFTVFTTAKHAAQS